MKTVSLATRLTVKAKLEGSATIGDIVAKRVLTSRQYGNSPWRIDFFRNGKKISKREV